MINWPGKKFFSSIVSKTKWYLVIRFSCLKYLFCSSFLSTICYSINDFCIDHSFSQSLLPINITSVLSYITTIHERGELEYASSPSAHPKMSPSMAFFTMKGFSKFLLLCFLISHAPIVTMPTLSFGNTIYPLSYNSTLALLRMFSYRASLSLPFGRLLNLLKKPLRLISVQIDSGYALKFKWGASPS